ncbi:uncharacterized protein LOC123915855 isoform X1 [Trifolium pratense]|uniref:uncharacterized protein LOC123915855 isoform X1 n=1 Tax=Trifolium pratense TaxID=57577 RepID=UPI001E691AE3|nr:uncharacterized protein LOC123915855 isoform X1 [Trifolium pratense]
MLSSLRFQPSNHSTISLTFNNPFPATTNNSHSQRTLSFTTKPLALPKPLSSFTTHSPQPSSHFISTVGSPSLNLPHWNLTQRHLTLLQVLAVVTSICTTWLFCSAIPTLLAFKRAAESLEKLMDTAREELPDTMAAIRLSGMEISDLTNELSDLGQEITQGVKSSTRVVRSAEERLRRFTTMMPSSSASLQGREYSPKTEPDSGVLAVARTARGATEGIIKGRGMLRMFFSLAQFSSFALKFITGRGKR